MSFAKILPVQPMLWNLFCSGYAIGRQLLCGIWVSSFCMWVENTHLWGIPFVAKALWLSHSSWRTGLLVRTWGSLWWERTSHQALVSNKPPCDKQGYVLILLTPWCCQPCGRSHPCRLPGRLLAFPASGWKPGGCRQWKITGWRDMLW